MNANQYGWIITVDYVEPDKVRIAPVMGPRDISDDMMRDLVNGAGIEFRMYNDDGELYYRGRWIGSLGSADMYRPLDGFGNPYAGCTEIRYKNEKGEFSRP